MPAQPGVFISYRREDAGGQARALHDRLVQRFGAGRVFMDVDSVVPGDDFTEKIEESIGRCGAVLVLIGREWLSARPDGSRRIDDPNDFVRLEIALALEHNIRLIPILIERAAMPDPADLPEALRPLTRRQALELENARWEYDASRLVQAVEAILKPAGGASVRATKKRHGTTRTQTLAVGAGIVVVGIIATVALLASNDKPHPKPGSPPSTRVLSRQELFAALLKQPYQGSDIAPGVSAPAVRVVPYAHEGLVGAGVADFPGPDDLGDQLFFYVFETDANARAWYLEDIVATGYVRSGTFVPAGFDGPVRCVTMTRAASGSVGAQARSVCQALLDTVTIYVQLTRTTAEQSANNTLAGALARAGTDRVKRLAATPPPSVPVFAKTPTELYRALVASKVDLTLTPNSLSNPQVSDDNLRTNGVVGVAHVTFAGAESGFYYDVFSSNDEARTYFNLHLGPSGSTRTSDSAATGFTQPAECVNYHHAASGPPDPERGQTNCRVLVDNVVIFAATASPTDTQRGDETLASTLARTALLHLANIKASA